MVLACSTCGKEFKRSPSRFAASKSVYCSQTCYHATGVAAKREIMRAAARDPIPAECHPGKKHYAWGLCEQCYIRAYRRQEHIRAQSARAHKRKTEKLSTEEKRRVHLKSRYKMTLEQFGQMVLGQEGQCAICERVPNRLFVDHNHTTKEVRGLLCHHCNVGISLLRENPRIFQKALDYLSKYASPLSAH